TNIPAEKRSTVTRSAMIRTNNWKLVIRNGSKEELYNLENDPQELYNLIDEDNFLKINLELKKQLLKWYLNTSDNPHWVKKRYI
ncbi:MAG: sulfatase/phosphatase domain-containing protein, partial [Promethearchaeota archaeon]